jgi:hypothetical protein
MPKPTSDEIVADAAEVERRFKALEDNASSSRSLLEKVAKKLGVDEPEPPKPKSSEKTKEQSIWVKLGLLQPTE